MIKFADMSMLPKYVRNRYFYLYAFSAIINYGFPSQTINRIAY